jgi:hypothetical protein
MILYARDQFGNNWGPLNPQAPKKSLLEVTCQRSATRMMIDKLSGETKHIGYVVSTPRGEYNLWCSLYWAGHHEWSKPA